MSTGKLVSSEVGFMYGRVEAYHDYDTRNDQATP
jgi:hypothetical protein